jgi:predicted PurR-regulated permease PerM
VKDFLTSGIVEVISFFTKASSTVLLSLPRLFLEFVIAILTMFYVLKDGKDIGVRLARLSPLKIHHQKELVKRFQDILFAVVYGTLFVAVIQGIYAGIGFALFGVDNAMIIAILVTFFALIPVVGTWVVWLPVVIYYILSSSGGGDFEMLKWILLILFGLSISTVDNIIKPVFIGGRARINALLVFVAAIGGVWLFGILGFIYGPIIIALAKVFFEIYEQEHLCPK